MKTCHCLLLALLYGFTAFGQPPPAPDPVLDLRVEAAVPEAGDDEADADKPPREQSIYIPYEKLRKVFEKKGRGVFMPYEDFQKLWKQSLGQAPKKKESESPVAYLMPEITGYAEVKKEVVSFLAQLSIEILKEGWHDIPLRLGDVAITKATLDGKPARIRHTGKGYSLLIQHTGKEPKVHELELHFSKSFTKAPGRNSLSFQSPLVPVSKWEVTINEPGVKVDIHPMLAATETPADPGGPADSTRMLAFVGATPDVRIEWTPKAEGAKGLKALVSVRAEQETRIEEGVARTRATLRYDISRAELTSLSFDVPAGQKVVNVFDPNVREWKVAVTGAVQRVSVELFEPTKGAQSLVVELERYSDASTVPVPVVQAQGVGRQQGVVTVKLGGGLRAEVDERTGLLQLDVQSLPGSLRGAKPEFAYRYVNLPFELAMDVEKIQPRIKVDSLVEAHLQPESLVLQVRSRYMVERAGVFKLEAQVPEGFDLRAVRGEAWAGATAVQVDHHALGAAADGMQPLNVLLSAKAQGPVGLYLELHRSLAQPDLLSPTGQAVDLVIPVPRAAGAFVEMEKGRLVVYGPESLRINPDQQQGLRSIAHSEAVGNTPSTQQGGKERPVLSYAFADEAASLSVTAERRAPHVTAAQLLLVQVDAGVVRYQDTLHYDVKYSGVKSLRLDIPTNLVEQVRIVTPGIRHSPLAEVEADAGYTAWKIEGETEFMGAVQFVLQWEDKIEKLDVGKSVELQVPRLQPMDADRAWGQIVLRKAEAIDVSPSGTVSGLRPIDPRFDLMKQQQIADAAQAFEFHDAWSLAVTATRYEPMEVKSTSIERGVVRAVLTRSGVTSMQAVYRVLSARQRLVMKLPGTGEGSFDTQPLRINGRPIPLEKGASGEFYIPLTNQEPDKPFLLEVRYTVSGAGKTIQVPEFPDEPAVQQIYLSVYLPREQAYLGYTGPWNAELVYALKGVGVTAVANRNKSENWMMNWVTQGVSGLDKSSLDTFAIDGRRLLYSTLRPEAAPAGGLHLRSLRAWVLSSLVIGLIVFIGITQVNAPLGKRALTVGSLLVLLVLAAVFAPSLARAMVNNATAAAAVIVGIIWVLWYLLVMLPKNPVMKNLMRPVPKPQPAAGPSETLTPDEPSDEQAPPEDEGEGDKGEDDA